MKKKPEIDWFEVTRITENNVKQDDEGFEQAYSDHYFYYANNFKISNSPRSWSDYIYYTQVCLIKSYEIFRQRRDAWEKWIKKTSQ